MAPGYQRGATGPYTHCLQKEGLLDAFIADYQKCIAAGWDHAKKSRIQILIIVEYRYLANRHPIRPRSALHLWADCYY
jgi:hypothetical protein